MNLFTKLLSCWVPDIEKSFVYPCDAWALSDASCACRVTTCEKKTLRSQYFKVTNISEVQNFFMKYEHLRAKINPFYNITVIKHLCWSLWIHSTSVVEISIPQHKTHLLLKSKYMCYTTIYWVTKPCLCLIGDGDCSLTAGVVWEMHEELWGIACTKDLMNGSKMCSPLVMAEVWCKDTSRTSCGGTCMRHKESQNLSSLQVPGNWCWLLYSYSLQLVKWNESSCSPFIMEATLAVGLALSIEWFVCNVLPNGLQVPLSQSPVPNSILVTPLGFHQNDSNDKGGKHWPNQFMFAWKKTCFSINF